MKATIKFKKLVPFAQTPIRKHNVDIGFDFYCTAINKTPKYIEYHTGIALEIPKGLIGLVCPMDTIIHKDLMLKNSIGIIKPSDRGEIIFIYNDNKQYTAIQKKEIYEIGEAVGQIIFFELPSIAMIEVEELSKFTE